MPRLSARDEARTLQAEHDIVHGKQMLKLEQHAEHDLRAAQNEMQHALLDLECAEREMAECQRVHHDGVVAAVTGNRHRFGVSA